MIRNQRLLMVALMKPFRLFNIRELILILIERWKLRFTHTRLIVLYALFGYYRILNRTLINRNDGFALHKISAHWYTLIGWFAVWIPGVVISYLTGGKDVNDVNFQLLAPCVRRIIPRRYRHAKLKVIHITKMNNHWVRNRYTLFVLKVDDIWFDLESFWCFSIVLE